MNRLAGVLFLVLTGPLWVLGLALVPVYLVERVCYFTALRGLHMFTRTMRGGPAFSKREPLSSRDRYFAHARNARKARKVVRP